MIEITEISPIKVSGLTSLRVTFPYSPEIVDRIKQFQPAVFHKKECFWEIPINYLAKLVDLLTFYDEIKLNLKRDEIREISVEQLTEDWLKKFISQK